MTTSPKFSSKARLTIDLDAIVYNYLKFIEHFPSTQASVVLKADAYGVGAVPVAKALFKAGCRQFHVAQLEEGIELRAHLKDAEIFILQGIVPGEAQDFYDFNLIPVLVDPYQFEVWAAFMPERAEKLACVLFVDTGMNRLGFTHDEFAAACADERLKSLDVRYVMTHLACSEEPENPMNEQQRQRLLEASALLPQVPVSLANSDILLLGGDYSFDQIRIGDGLYGMVKGHGLKAVIGLNAPILQVRHLNPGERVGYGGTHLVERPTRIVVVPIGYADGFYWQLGNKGMAIIQGYEVPVIGRVSMDMITLDVTDVPESMIFPGAQVEIMGDHYTPNDVAAVMQTNVREILTRLGHRFERYYVGGGLESNG